MKKKVYVVGGTSEHYACFLSDVQLVRKIEEANIVLFTGGEDVTPDFYGKEAHRRSYFNRRRDEEERAEFLKIRKDQSALGICRGSQFLCVMNGGILVQDCNNHAIWGGHEITNKEGEVYEITSTHHQMQYPYDLDPNNYDVLFIASPNRCTYYEGDGIVEEVLAEKGEPEIVLYHNPELPVCLAIQGHPEMIPESEIAKKLDKLVESLIEKLC